MPSLPFDGSKLDQHMDEAGLDVLLASTRHNVRYLTGGYVYHFNERCQRAGAGQYLAFVGLVRRRLEDAFYVGTGMERMGLEARPIWIDQRDLTGGSATSSPGVAASHVQKLAGPSPRIGVEMPFLPAASYLALQQAVPRATLVDATNPLHELRAIKTDAELAILRDVSERVAESIQVGFRSGRDGITTRDIAETIERDMGKRGLAFLWAFTNAGPGYLRAPSSTRWQRGRLMHLDCGGEQGDYLADICRMGALGEPPALGRELVDECLEVQEAVREILRAGAAYGETQAAADRALARTPHAAMGRVVAHGIGMVSHEQPMINVKSQAGRALALGHVLSVETEYHHPEIGHVKIEDTLAITPDGCQGLGDLGRDLAVIPA